MIDTIKKFIEKTKLKSLSFQIVGITFELEIEGVNKSELQEILRDLYTIRIALADFYFTYQTNYAFIWDINGVYEVDSESEDLIEDDDNIKEELAQKYFIKALDLYEHIEKLYCESKYFIYLPRKTRDNLTETFNSVRIINSTFEFDENYVLETEEVVQLVQTILYLYSSIENAIKEINDKLENIS